MKSLIVTLLLPAIALGYSQDTTEDIRVAQSIRKSASHIRASSSVVRHVTSDEVCEAEVFQLESNTELTTSLDTLISELDTSFNENFHDYCTISMNPSGILMECAMDYEQYSSDYVSLCNQNNGVVHTIRFLSICQSEQFHMEIELSNLPSCFGKSCDVSKVYDVIALLLDVTETFLNEDDSGMKCSIIHDYDNGLSHDYDNYQPTIDTPDVSSVSTSQEDSSGYDSHKKTFLRFVSALVAGSVLLF
jgi:hypothetical protein